MNPTRTQDEQHQLNIAIGQEVRTRRGEPAGTVDRVVVSPTLSRLTHVVVRPGPGIANKLVPIEELDLLDGDLAITAIRRWPRDFDDAESLELLELSPQLAGPDLAWPLGGTYVWPWLDEPVGPRAVLQEHLPLGEVSVGVGSDVLIDDESIGRVAGFVTEPEARRVTHVVLRHGHLWGRRTVVIPVDLVTATPSGDLSVDVERDELERYAV